VNAQSVTTGNQAAMIANNVTILAAPATMEAILTAQAASEARFSFQTPDIVQISAQLDSLPQMLVLALRIPG